MTGWVSVAEALPKPGQLVVVRESRKVALGRYTHEREWAIRSVPAIHPTHWHPLEAFEDDDDEEDNHAESVLLWFQTGVMP